MVLILSITECTTRQTNKVVCVFSLFLQFSTVVCLPSLILLSPLHLPQHVRQPSCVIPLFKYSPSHVF